VHVRLTGQDTERGTFSHRHLVLHDEKTGLKYCPMQHLDDAGAPFELYNSPLSEAACLGFEYGYSAAEPDSLILWEAQFGDFGNAAQVIIDSFIVSGEAKWGQVKRLTLLLPHGYEGGGPEHSSARIERFLALAAEGNIRIANPTTAAQYFHLLRRQALIKKARPLIVFTPKSLLRLDRASSTLEELTNGRFHFVLDDPTAGERREKVERLVMCSGKIYHEMDATPRREAAENVAIARVELLYPFARDQLQEVISSYPKLKEVVWVQEEPKNMGEWKVMWRRVPELLPEGVSFSYIGRPERASPGEVQEGLRRALRDDTAQVAYWYEEDRHYVDVDGNRFELPPDTRERVVTRLDYADEPVAAIVHDAALREEPELLDGIANAARIALRAGQAARGGTRTRAALLSRSCRRCPT